MYGSANGAKLIRVSDHTLHVMAEVVSLERWIFLTLRNIKLVAWPRMHLQCYKNVL